MSHIVLLFTFMIWQVIFTVYGIKEMKSANLGLSKKSNHRASCIKMAMISAVLVVISSGLDILGVEPATHMN